LTPRSASAGLFVRGLGLKSATEWREYCQSGGRPADIPSNPHKVYTETGWTSWGDWLGTGRIADGLQKYLPFKKARKFARSLNLKGEYEWRNYCKSGMKPANIPAAPAQKYAEMGWAGFSDWLGTGRRRGSNFRPFKEGRAFVRRLKLKSYTEWTGYLTILSQANSPAIFRLVQIRIMQAMAGPDGATGSDMRSKEIHFAGLEIGANNGQGLAFPRQVAPRGRLCAGAACPVFS
jgi:hypothetical protein